MSKFNIKKINFFLSFILIFLLHIPFVFAKSVNIAKHLNETEAIPAAVNRPTVASVHSNRISFFSNSLYDSLQLESKGLTRQVFDYALKGFYFMREMGMLENKEIISIIDFSKPSSEKRLFIIDLQNVKLLFKTYVAHGANSGKAFAKIFSNAVSSNKSSLGFYETLNTYEGGNGYSLRLQGMEQGINDNANKRAIVLHGAGYVDERLIHSQGYIGRSWGCPAVPQALHRPIIDKIKNGSCLFIFSPNSKYLKSSKIINSNILPS
jgi:hypothetical protein